MCGDACIFGSQDMPDHVKFMRCRVGDRHGPGKVGRRRFHVAVEVVHHQRPAQRAVSQDRTHFHIGLIEASHEPQHHMARACGFLSPHNVKALR